MEILWWLVPAVAVTGVAMVWAVWAGRPRDLGPDRSEAAYERFAAAIERDHPAANKARPGRPRDCSTGIAVRPSRRAEDGEVTRSDRLPAQPRRRSAVAPDPLAGLIDESVELLVDAESGSLIEEPQAG